LNHLCHSKTLDVSLAPLPQALETTAQLSFASFPNFTQNLMLIRCSKNRSLICAQQDVEIHASYQLNFHTPALIR
jgi:hypothetical protein